VAELGVPLAGAFPKPLTDGAVGQPMSTVRDEIDRRVRHLLGELVG
jgi:hypothetical protein